MGDIWGEGQADERPYRFLNLGNGFGLQSMQLPKEI